MALRIASLLAAGLAACGGGFTSAVLVTFDVDELPPAGGGYRIRLLHPDGTAISDLEPQFVTTRDGDQQVTLLLESAGLYDGTGTATVRVFVEMVLSEDAAAADVLAIGSASVTVSKGEVQEVEVRLVADPRPLTFVGDVVARYNSSPTGEPGTHVEVTADVVVPGGFSLVAWLSLDGGVPTQLGSLVDGRIYGDAQVGRIVSHAGDAVVTLVIEPSDAPEQLAAALGWLVRQGTLQDEYRALLEAWLGDAGVLEQVDANLDLALQHAGFALSDPSGTHSEHVFNVLADTDDDANGDGDVDRIVPATEPGLQGYLAEILGGEAATVSESGDPAMAATLTATVNALEACGARALTALADAMAAAHDTAAGDVALATGGPLTVSALETLIGDPYSPTPAVLERQTVRCVTDLTAALAVFPLVDP